LNATGYTFLNMPLGSCTVRNSPSKAGHICSQRSSPCGCAREAGAVYAPYSFYYGPGYLASLHMAAACPNNPLMEQPYFALEAYPFGENALAEKGEVTGVFQGDG